MAWAAKNGVMMASQELINYSVVGVLASPPHFVSSGCYWQLGKKENQGAQTNNASDYNGGKAK